MAYDPAISRFGNRALKSSAIPTEPALNTTQVCWKIPILMCALPALVVYNQIITCSLPQRRPTTNMSRHN